MCAVTVCSFRPANRFSALTSQNIAYGTITQISAISRLNCYTPNSLPITTPRAAEIPDNFIELPPASRVSLDLISPLRLVALPHEPIVSVAQECMASRQGFLEKSHECQQCDREDAQAKR